jgi:uncharacterized protein (DUF1697 family)
MLITHKSTYTCVNVAINTAGIASNCNSITFDNAGDADAKIFMASGNVILKAGKSIDLGQRVETIIMDTFSVEFIPAAGAVQLVNIIRETFQILT